ncbi:MAG TPA: NADP-dependent oxidoreductase, partial [Burkholderiaceae bacterium]|nr:NADP-dependent oxidoreductase [Burkholderiaceae bacterium]
MTDKNRRIVLASRPQGPVTPENFRLEETPVPKPADGEVLVRNHFLSLDPYMRGMLDERKSYRAPQPLNEVMTGGTVGEVVESRHPDFAAGDRVVGHAGWQLYGCVPGSMLRRIDPASKLPLSVYLGAVGMPGVTAWYGLTQII